MEDAKKTLAKMYAKKIIRLFDDVTKGKRRASEIVLKVSEIYNKARVAGVEAEVRAEVDRLQ